MVDWCKIQWPNKIPDTANNVPAAKVVTYLKLAWEPKKAKKHYKIYSPITPYYASTATPCNGKQLSKTWSMKSTKANRPFLPALKCLPKVITSPK